MSGAENDQILYDLASVMPWNCRNNIVQNQIQKNNKKSKKNGISMLYVTLIVNQFM